MMLPFLFTACGDDEPSGNGNEGGGGLNGTWVLSGLTDDDSTGSWTFKFSGSSVTYIEKWSEPGYDDDIETSTGNFEVENGIISMHLIYNYGSGSDTYDWAFEYSIKGKELTLIPANTDARSYFGSKPFTLKKK